MHNQLFGETDVLQWSPRNALVYTEKENKLHVEGEYNDCDPPVASYNDEHSLQSREINDFLRNGYFVVPNAISQVEVNAARKYVDSQYNRWIKHSKRQDDWRCHLQLDIRGLISGNSARIEHAPILNLLLKSPAVINRLRTMMGADPSGIFYSQVAYRTPVKAEKKAITKVPSPDYKPGAEYHLDGSANSSGTRFPDPWTVMVGVALVDILTTDMGNFTVFPGSHTSRDWSRYPEEKVAKTLPDLGRTEHLCLPAGGVVFVHVLLAHRGGKNVKGQNAVSGGDVLSGASCSSSRDSDHGLRRVGGENSDVYVATHIPADTREMVFIRVQAAGIDYLAPERAERVLHDPWYEFRRMCDEHLFQITETAR